MPQDTKTDETKRRSSPPTDTKMDNAENGQPTRNRPHCKVLLLDGEYCVVPVDKKAKGEVVIKELFRHLELKDLQEKEYFSVYYIDHTGCMIFLNPFNQIRRQLPNASSRTTWELYFGVQFYATELSMLADEMTRYLYVLQICRDIKEKRLYADHATKLQLVSLLVQANCGDYDTSEHRPGYVEPYIDMIYNSAEIPVGMNNSAVEVHKDKTGFKPSEADNAFFMIAKSLYKFGQQVFPIRDRLGQSGQIGASITGLFFHKDGKCFVHIEWADVITVGYRRKKLRIRYHPKGSADDTEEMLYLRCSEPSAKLVWRGCVEQHTFFRLERPTPLVESTAKSYYSFNRNSELRFSRGRTLYQMLRSAHKPQPQFQRSLSFHIIQRNKDKDDDDEPEPAQPETPVPEPAPKVIIIPLPDDLPDDENNPKDDTDSRRESLQSDSLQRRIEEALKQRSGEHINVDVEIKTTNSDEGDTAIVTTVEIEGTDEQTSSDTEEEPNDGMEFDVRQNPSHMTVEVTNSDPDIDAANVEFSAEKNNSGYMVTLEETTPSPPPPDLNDAVMLEGKYRNDSIISNDLGPLPLYLMEKSNLKDGTVTATAVDIEVRTPTPTYDETRADLIENEMHKVSDIHASSENDVEVTSTAENF